MTEKAVPAYPDAWAADVVLSDGGTAHLRPIRPTDTSALVELHGRLSPETVYFRFFSAHPVLTDEEVQRFTNVDYVERMALVAELDGRMIGVARYDREPGTDEAEAAFVVADEHQGRGLGSLLLEHIAATARAAGISRLTATVLPMNQRMLGVFRDAGFVRKSQFEDGVVSVVLDIAPTPTWQLAVDERDRRASVRSIERLLKPRSVAVIGASREPGTVGHAVFRNVVAGGFEGAAYPVNAATTHVSSIRAFGSVADIPDEVDLAIIAVPASQVDGVVASCGAKGVKSVVILSAGFADVGDREHERAVVELAHSHGMRVVGPNCIGVVNTDPSVRLHASFGSALPPAGRIAFSSQSGALGMAVLQDAARLGIGVSTFVSVGNKADVSGNDLIQFWEQDPETDVVLLYLESFGNPRRFSRIARRVSRTKPIVAVKSGNRDGRDAAVVDALFLQTGVIRVETLEELFHTGRLLAAQPLPRGRRLGIVSNAGGPASLAADACTTAGLDVVALEDLSGAATADDYGRCVSRLLDSGEIDALVVVFAPALSTRPAQVADAVQDAVASHPDLPVVANLLAVAELPESLQRPRDIPNFRYPETAIRALGRVAAYAEWRRRPQGLLPELPGLDVARARAVIARALAGTDHVTLDGQEAEPILAAFGIDPSAATATVTLRSDPSFGHIVDVDGAPRVLPLTDVDVAELVGGESSLQDLVLRVAALGEHLVEVVAATVGPASSSVTISRHPERQEYVRRLR